MRIVYHWVLLIVFHARSRASEQMRGRKRRKQSMAQQFHGTAAQAVTPFPDILCAYSERDVDDVINLCLSKMKKGDKIYI